MTNHWADIGNASNVLVWGANPSENHPACMAHINKARGNQNVVWPDGKKGAKLVVVDPRKTRTALQADQYIRIRPGTDIALLNGVVREVISQMEGTTGSVDAGVKAKFFEFLNETSAQTVYDDANAALTTVAGGSKYTDARFLVQNDASDYVRATATAASTASVSNFPSRAATVDADVNTVYNRLKAHVDPYTLSVTSGIVGCTQQEILDLVKYFVDNGRCSSIGPAVPGAGVTGTQDPRVAGYRVLTMLYAMGITQHTVGSQNVKDFAVIQTLMGNMGRAGGGINALRGIHNVQGSTDMGLLYGNIPAYSSNPSVLRSADANAFGKYMDALWGNPLSGTGTRVTRNGSYDDAYVTGAMGLQQRGFFNMTLKFFGGYAQATAAGANVRNIADNIYDLWPKGNGVNHMQMFRDMISGTTKALVCWGQNPAVTEPNQGKIRAGLKNLDLLVVTDMFETETATADRKDGSTTYLLPACSHVEHAGSATNSGRTLQWRYRAVAPKGNSKDDIELLLRLAHALEGAGAFSHFASKWAAAGVTGGIYANLYGTPYGWTPGTPFEGANAGLTDVEFVTLRKTVNGPGSTYTATTATGAEAVAEAIYREMMAPVAAGGTLWIYTGAYNAGATWTTDNKGAQQAPWAAHNRAKSRDNSDNGGFGTLAYHGWGYAWLVNRRVFYNNGDVPGDVADFFMGPDSCSRLFVSTYAPIVNYSRWYRTVHKLVDKPDVVLPATLNAGSPHFVPKPGGGTITYAGRFPAHCEPYETPKADLALAWGRNTKGGGAYDLTFTDSQVAGRDVPATDYPLILTTIRCVEHFQGGPITRNNALNVEIEPEPWIEINAADAATYKIADGDWVNIITARGNSTAGQAAINNPTPPSPSGAPAITDGFGKGFRARVGVGLSTNQRVGPGVVAIPWHWGERGLSTGARANDLCIDAGDANSMIPESKVCLCRIQKA